jgi:DNA-binding response OmpR family regulator
MKILIHYERPDIPEFLLEIIVNHGYKVGLAKDGSEIMYMVSDDRYNVILTNGGYGELNPDHHTLLKSSSVFIIGITDSHKQTQDLKADVYLPRPFLISELWRTMETPLQLFKECSYGLYIFMSSPLLSSNND